MDLLISTNASATRATVNRAPAGAAPADAFVVRPGESLYDVPYDAWLPRVGETVDLRVMQDGIAQAALAKEDAEEDEERDERSVWTRPVDRRVYLAFALYNGFLLFRDRLREASDSWETAWLAVIAIAILCSAVGPFVGRRVPGWVHFILLPVLVVLTALQLIF